MKKILALLLAAMMTLSLAACGSDTGSTDEDSVDTAGQDTAEPSADDDFAYETPRNAWTVSSPT